jgi:hypothetical protein
MARTTYNATIIVRVAVDVSVTGSSLADAVESAKSLSIGELIKPAAGCTFNDFEKELQGVNTNKWING